MQKGVILATIALLSSPFAHAQTPMVPTMNGIILDAGAQSAGSLTTTHQPFRLDVGPITGAWAPGGASTLNRITVSGDTARGDGWNDAVGALELSYDWGGLGGAAAGSGGRYALRAYTSTHKLLNKGVAGVSFPYIVTGEFKSTVHENAGGNSKADPWGGQYVLNTVATLAPGATALSINTTGEFDLSSFYGSSAADQSGGVFVQLAIDWGDIGYNDGRTGRNLLSFNQALPGVDTTSPASTTATAGRQLPAQDFGFIYDTALFGPDSRLFGFRLPVSQNTNSCASCGASGAAVPAAIRKPPQMGWGLDLRKFNMTNQPFASTGFQVQANGEVDVGVGKIIPTDGAAGVLGTGVTIDVTGSYVSAAAQSGTWGPKQVGEQMSDSFGGGGIYEVKTTDNSVSPGIGNVTAWTIIRPSHVSGAPPCTTSCTVEGAGAPALINLTWTKPNRLDLNPTGQSTFIAPFLSVNAAQGILAIANITCDTCDLDIKTNGHGVFFTDTAGHKPALGTSGDNTVLTYIDSAGGSHPAFSVLNNRAATPPAAFFVQTPLKLQTYTTAQIGACNAALEGSMVLISDASAPTYNGTLVGGGSVTVPALCHGGIWTTH